MKDTATTLLVGTGGVTLNEAFGTKDKNIYFTPERNYKVLAISQAVLPFPLRT